MFTILTVIYFYVNVRVKSLQNSVSVSVSNNMQVTNIPQSSRIEREKMCKYLPRTSEINLPSLIAAVRRLPPLLALVGRTRAIPYCRLRSQYNSTANNKLCQGEGNTKQLRNIATLCTFLSETDSATPSSHRGRQWWFVHGGWSSSTRESFAIAIVVEFQRGYLGMPVHSCREWVRHVRNILSLGKEVCKSFAIWFGLLSFRERWILRNDAFQLTLKILRLSQHWFW